MMLVVVPTFVSNHTYKHQIMPLANVDLLLFGRSSSLPLRCAKASLRVSYERLTSSIDMDYSQEDYRLNMDYCHLRKYPLFLIYPLNESMFITIY